VLGMEHPNTLTSMNNLAAVLSDQGKYDEAEQMLRNVLGIRQKVLGMEHPDTLSSVIYLAGVLSHQGKHDEVEQMHRDVLKKLEHPDILLSMIDLVLTTSSRSLRLQHPNTQRS